MLARILLLTDNPVEWEILTQYLETHEYYVYAWGGCD